MIQVQSLILPFLVCLHLHLLSSSVPEQSECEVPLNQNSVTLRKGK